jgi:hypothetical protein
MRKEPKHFTVEVKRRPAAGAKKPRAFVPVEAAPAATAADILFRAPDASVEPPKDEPARRILPCLVTEAALETAKAEALADHAPPPRPRGRPRKERTDADLAPVAPRKRGRPRKVPIDMAAERPSASAQPQRFAPVFEPPAEIEPYQPSDRAIARRSAVAALPRGERWKRRLPKALR